MGKDHCWEIRDCGKGPNSINPCIATEFDLADGYLDGENGSRACFYIQGTQCFEDDEFMTIPEKLHKYCLDCEVYQTAIKQHGIQSNIFYYLKYLHNKLFEEDRLHELPIIQDNLFHNL